MALVTIFGAINCESAGVEDEWIGCAYCRSSRGMVDQELLARNEYLAAENRILKARLRGRLKLSGAERATLSEIGHRLGRMILSEVASLAQPDTILAWYRKLGRPQIRWLEGPSKPRQTSDQARGRAADRSHGQGEP